MPVAQDACQTIKHSSKLMQNYTGETLVDGQKDLIAVRDANGKPVLFTVSNGGNVYFLREELASDTGWSAPVKVLALNASPAVESAAQMAAGTDENDTLVVCAISNDGRSLKFA